MDMILVQGGIPLSGEVTVDGAKNAALPLLFASLLTDAECRLDGIPRLVDVRTALRLLNELGVETAWLDDHQVVLNAKRACHVEAPYDLVKTMRASFLVLGPLLARFGRARVSTPGGCAIGTRPVNIHLAGLQKLGAAIHIRHGYVEARADRLTGADIDLDFPSVGATENLMMAASLAHGTTVLRHAAREPEIGDLADLLGTMGAQIDGAGSDTIVIDGVAALHGARHHVIPDRVEAGTFLIAGAITSGNVLVRGARVEHLASVLHALEHTGVQLREEGDGVRVLGNGRPAGVELTTRPYPGFPTDLQAQMMALLTLGEQRSTITETVFDNRFLHAQELVRLGADVHVHGHTATIHGVAYLSGAPVMATDLRASVSLILAGLAARGETQVSRIYHLDRGYERLEAKLSLLGARIQRRADQPAQ